jgi:hypothetical protein
LPPPNFAKNFDACFNGYLSRLLQSAKLALVTNMFQVDCGFPGFVKLVFRTGAGTYPDLRGRFLISKIHGFLKPRE